jgi:tetratricopeptide (TPR) repeat protein
MFRYFFYFLCTSLVLLYITFLPNLNYEVGNIFFGGVPKLYNIKLAQFFFERASYPLLGKSYPYAHHQLSRTYFIQGDLDTSINEAHKELEIYPDHMATYYIIGLTLGYMNHEKKAIEAFTKYIEYNPASWAARNDKAWLQFRIGDIDGAIVTLEPLVKNFKYTPWVQNTYCALLIAKKDYSKALEPCMNAQEDVKDMTEVDWGHAYPGNDPRIYSIGLEAMKISINQNMQIINKNLKK